MREESDSEEEILVYAEFEDSVNIDKYRSIHILGVDEKNPIVQLDETFFMGKYENALGTYMFFEEDTSTLSKDPLFDKYPEKCVKYVGHTRKLMTMEHAYVTPKEGKETSYQSQTKPMDEDVQPVTFANLEEATEAFKSYFISDAASATQGDKPVNES